MGERHIFVRFEECHIHCKYCDELGKPAEEMGLDRAAGLIEKLDAESGPHSFVSFTGGEPLLYLTFLKPLMERLKGMGHRIYLETDGILHTALAQVIDLCDCVAMDMKPASVTGERNFFAEHEKFLEIAVRKETFVKIVVSRELLMEEFEKLAEIVKKIAPQIPFIIQSVSSQGEGLQDREISDFVIDLQKRASMFLPNARIMPRLHKIMGVR